MIGGDAQIKEGMTVDIEEMDRIVDRFLERSRDRNAARAYW